MPEPKPILIYLGGDLPEFRTIFSHVSGQLVVPAMNEFIDFVEFTPFQPYTMAIGAFVNDQAAVIAIVDGMG